MASCSSPPRSRATSPSATCSWARPSETATSSCRRASSRPTCSATFVAPPGESLYLRLVQEPLNGIELARWRLRPDRPHFQARRPAGPRRALRPPGRRGLHRLAAAARHRSRRHGRGGAGQVRRRARGRPALRLLRARRPPRRLDRPPVPLLLLHERLPLHVPRGQRPRGRLGAGASSTSRSGPTGPRPVWIAAAAHDYIGDELRRRWDDPTLVMEGDHPVLYAGAGSHAELLRAGRVPHQRAICGACAASRASWTRRRIVLARHAAPARPGRPRARSSRRRLSASFVDYARGDGTGRRAGPGDEPGARSLISDADAGSTATAACSGSTPTTGSVASAPRPGRSTPARARSACPGTTRSASPGLDKARPPVRWPDELARAARRCSRRGERGWQPRIAQRNRHAARAGARGPGARLDGGMAALHDARAGELAAGEIELRGLRAHAASHRRSDHRRRAARRMRIEDRRPRRSARAPDATPPAGATGGRRKYSVIVEIWSAVSAAFLLATSPRWSGSAPAVVGGAGDRGWGLRRPRVGVPPPADPADSPPSVILAVVAGAVLLLEFSVQAILLAILGLALFVLVDNIRELTGR